MRQEKGISLSGFLVISALLIVGLLFLFKIGPAYFEYYQVNRTLQAIVADSEMQGASPQTLRDVFDRRASIDNIRAISAADLEISKGENGGALIEATWAVKVPVVGNLSACMDFEASSAK